MTGNRPARRIAAALAAAVTICLASTPAGAAEPVIGRWLTLDQKALVEIGRCGKAMCGQIVKVLKHDPKKSRYDVENPDPKLRSRPIEGLTMLWDFRDVGSLWKGKIYDPESGSTYSSKLTRNPDGTLKVQGCIAFFCRTQTWTPAR